MTVCGSGSISSYLAPDFLKLRGERRSVQIEKIADDIEGYWNDADRYQHRRNKRDETRALGARPADASLPPMAHDLNEYGFIRGAEVVLDKPAGARREKSMPMWIFLSGFMSSMETHASISGCDGRSSRSMAASGTIAVDERYKGAAGRNYSVTLQMLPTRSASA